MADRLTLKDFDRLKPWATEIALCKDCEAAAYRDFEDAEHAVRQAAIRIANAKCRLKAAKDDTESAELAFQAVFNEMTRSALIDDDAVLAEQQREAG